MGLLPLSEGALGTFFQAKPHSDVLGEGVHNSQQVAELDVIAPVHFEVIHEEMIYSFCRVTLATPAQVISHVLFF